MKLAARDRLLITIGVIAVVLVLLVVFLVVPQFGKVNDLNSQIDQANSDIASAQSLLEQRQQIKSRAAQTDAELLKLLNAVPGNPELPGYIIELQDLCIESGVWLDRVTPVDPVLNEGFSGVSLRVRTLGSWADTIDFMRRVHSMTRQTRTIEFDSNLAEAAEHPIPVPDFPVRTEFQLEIYYIPTSATATGTPPATPAAPAQ